MKNIVNGDNGMTCTIETLGGTETVKWFHSGEHVFTVTTQADGSVSYKAVA